MKKFGLVLEGGAARGIYTAGVLDVLLENGLRADGVMGVSAGAIHGISYAAGQCGRSYCFSVKYCKDSRFMSFRSFLRTGDICGAKFCYYDIPQHLVPFAHESFINSKTDFYCVCTDVKTGLPVYHKCEDMRGAEIEWVRASASMPLVSNTVEIDGQMLLDGGVADSIPFRAFMQMDYGKTIVVCTQHDGYRKETDVTAKLMPLRYGKYPAFVQTMQNRAEMYNAQLDDLKTAENNGEVLVIRPSEPLAIGRIEHDPAVIRSVYMLGRQDALRRLEEIIKFVN
ncbi:MAG: patatin family protein [Clostridia bacterium]|nr:patatin family protein [Clostridia bacterium]